MENKADWTFYGKKLLHLKCSSGGTLPMTLGKYPDDEKHTCAWCGISIPKHIMIQLRLLNA